MPSLGLSLKLSAVRAVAGGAAPFVGALDAYTADLTIALSVGRRLLTSYEGPLIRVRRDSDDAEDDFSAGEDGLLDTAALLTFVGAGNGYIRTIYGQVGLGHDVARDFAAAQMQIVASGVLLTDGDFAAGLSSGTPAYAVQASPGIQDVYGSNSMAAILRVRPGNSGTDNRILYTSDDQLSLYAALSNDVIYWDHGFGGSNRVDVAQPSGWNNAWHWLRVGRQADGTQDIAVDGSVIATASRSQTLNSGTPFVYMPYQWNGHIREMVVWKSGANAADKEAALMA